jgi:hypothetical protein
MTTTAIRAGTLMVVAVFVGLASSAAASERRPAVSGDRVLVIAMTGHASALLLRHTPGGPAQYRERGVFRVVWRVPESELANGRRFASDSAVVTGTASASFANSPHRSCEGLLAASTKPFELLVVGSPLAARSHGDSRFVASPSPFATAISKACPLGLAAARWRLPVPPVNATRQQKLRYAAREKAWRIYNNPGFGLAGKNFIPSARGGSSEGFGLGFGSAGSFSWVAFLKVRTTPA